MATHYGSPRPESPSDTKTLAPSANTSDYRPRLGLPDQSVDLGAGTGKSTSRLSEYWCAADGGHLRWPRGALGSLPGPVLCKIRPKRAAWRDAVRHETGS